MPFEIAVELTEGHERLARDHADRRPRGIEQRRRVALAQHEPIARRIARRLRIEGHHVEEDRRDEVGRGGARRRMAAAGGGGRAHAVHAQLGGHVLEGEQAGVGGAAHGHSVNRCNANASGVAGTVAARRAGGGV